MISSILLDKSDNYFRQRSARNYTHPNKLAQSRPPGEIACHNNPNNWGKIHVFLSFRIRSKSLEKQFCCCKSILVV